MEYRQQELLKQIAKAMSPLTNIYLIEKENTSGYEKRSYVISIKKLPNRSFEQRVFDLYHCLLSSLNPDEHLSCKDKCFSIMNDLYSITYIWEGYSKHPDRIGYAEPISNPLEYTFKSVLMKRMSIDIAYTLLRKQTPVINKKELLIQMQNTEL